MPLLDLGKYPFTNKNPDESTNRLFSQGLSRAFEKPQNAQPNKPLTLPPQKKYSKKVNGTGNGGL